MTKNPILNALGATAYIVAVVALIDFISSVQSDKTDTAFAPVVFLSLLTLSVAMMAYIFFVQPLKLFVEGQKKEAIDLFIQTVGAFAVLTTVVLTLLLIGIF